MQQRSYLAPEGHLAAKPMMAAAPERLHTMVVSGDVLIRTTQPLQPIPDADVVCYGLWLDASVAKNHGVFVSDRRTPSVLKQMLQKPSVQTLSELQKDHFYLTDIGVWLLSDKAISLLMQRSLSSNASLSSPASFKEYDLYSEFGCCLGTEPSIDDPELRQLSVAILPLAGGEFYHFGTSREMIASTMYYPLLVFCIQLMKPSELFIVWACSQRYRFGEFFSRMFRKKLTICIM